MFLVADRENRSVDGAGACARKKLLRQESDNLPLLRARVLSLVDQHVVDALIELVVYPGGAVFTEQSEGLVDQIVVVEEPAPILRRSVAGDNGIGDGDERRRAIAAGDGLAALYQHQQSLTFALKEIGEPGIARLDHLGDQSLARFELVGEKKLQIAVGAFRAGSRDCVREPSRLFLIALRSLRQCLGSGRPAREREQRAVRHRVFDPLDCVIAADSERSAQNGDGCVDVATVLDPAPHDVTLADGFADHLLERAVGGDRNSRCERASESGIRGQGRIEQHAEAALAQELGFRRLVEHAEPRGDRRLEWKLMQQPRAEGVDGLHLEPAGGLQRQCEQPPGSRPLRRVGTEVGHSPDRCIERLIVECGPAPQLVEHAVRHIGGGGLGECDAENFIGLDAVEQEPDHALRQNVGLARSGIGCDPGGHRRIRRFDL